MHSALSSWAGIVAFGFLVACSTADDPPLGGPHGGTAVPVQGPQGEPVPVPPPTAPAAPSSGGENGGTTSAQSTGSPASGEMGNPADSGPASSAPDTGTSSPPPAVDSGATPAPVDAAAPPADDAALPAQDSAVPPPPDAAPPPPPPPPPTAPTWTDLYGSYLAGGTEGNCSNCHSQMGSASGAYSYLSSKGYIGSGTSSLDDPNNSCLTWFGGNMPPSGGSDMNAVNDFDAWVAAGAQDN
jgi:hypothetical protein